MTATDGEGMPTEAEWLEGSHRNARPVTTIEQIRKELEAATPGPWVEHDDEIWGHTATIVSHRRICTPRDANRVANATLIAHAPAYLAALLDVAEAAQVFRGGPGVEFAGVLGRLNDALDRLDAVTPQQYAKDGE